MEGRLIVVIYDFLFLLIQKQLFSNEKQTKQYMWKCMKQTAIRSRPRVWELYAEYNWFEIHAVVTAAEAFIYLIFYGNYNIKINLICREFPFKFKVNADDRQKQTERARKLVNKYVFVEECVNRQQIHSSDA